MIKRVLLSYFAGFFDGEGYIGIPTVRSKFRSLTVNVTQKDKTVLNFFQCAFGGGISKNKVNQCYQWYIYSDGALRFLKELLPFLMLKAGQARIAIEFQEIKNARDYRRLTIADIALEEAHQKLIKEAKRV